VDRDSLPLHFILRIQGVWENKEMHIKFWLGNLKGKDNLKYLVVDGRVILK
jgi:hypothetical protein